MEGMDAESWVLGDWAGKVLYAQTLPMPATRMQKRHLCSCPAFCMSVLCEVLFIFLLSEVFSEGILFVKPLHFPSSLYQMFCLTSFPG